MNFLFVENDLSIHFSKSPLKKHNGTKLMLLVLGKKEKKSFVDKAGRKEINSFM